MSDEGTVNTQVIDATSDIVTLLTGQSPAQSFAMLDAVMVETLGMAMHNAVHRQQNAGMVNSAAVTAACAKMLSVPFPTTPPPPPSGSSGSGSSGSGSSGSGGSASPLQPLTPLLTTSLTTLPPTVTGGSGNSTVTGGTGNSTVTGGTGNSTVSGGS
ncbi:RebB family R body protein [Azospirillum argentinense]|uniref:RebB family R body protein n=1 Tax=Azospirillum argentinense TaxID=2970906 RepID=A0ABW8VFQ0_9PROT